VTINYGTVISQQSHSDMRMSTLSDDIAVILLWFITLL